MEAIAIDIAAAVAALPALGCEGDELHRVAAFFAKYVSGNPAGVPVTHCLSIEPCEEGARIYATDLNGGRAITIAAQWRTPGLIIVNAKALANITKKLTKRVVSIECTAPRLEWNGERQIIGGRPEADSVTIRSGRARYRLPMGDAEQFPIMLHIVEMTLADIAAADAAAKAERAAAKPARAVTITSEAVLIEADGTETPIATGNGKITLSAEQVRELCGDDLFATVAFTMPDGSTAYVLQWQLDEGWQNLRTVPADGKMSGKVAMIDGVLRGSTRRDDVTRDYVLAAIECGGAPAQDANASTGQADTPPAPVNTLSGQEIAPADPIAELTARIERLEAMLAASAPVAAPLSVKSDATPIAQPARAPRAVRERIVRAYLRMRADRAKWHSIAEASQAEHDVLMAERDSARAKRRSAVLNARDLQQRLYAEHKLVDRYAGRVRQAEARHAAAVELADERLTERNNEMERAHVAEREVKQAADERDTLQAIADRATANAERLATRALSAENTVRALEARLLRGTAPVVIANPAVTWRKAA